MSHYLRLRIVLHLFHRIVGIGLIVPIPLILGWLIVAIRAGTVIGITLALTPRLQSAIMMFPIFAGVTQPHLSPHVPRRANHLFFSLTLNPASKATLKISWHFLLANRFSKGVDLLRINTSSHRIITSTATCSA